MTKRRCVCNEAVRNTLCAASNMLCLPAVVTLLSKLPLTCLRNGSAQLTFCSFHICICRPAQRDAVTYARCIARPAYCATWPSFWLATLENGKRWSVNDDFAYSGNGLLAGVSQDFDCIEYFLVRFNRLQVRKSRDTMATTTVGRNLVRGFPLHV